MNFSEFVASMHDTVREHPIRFVCLGDTLTGVYNEELYHPIHAVALPRFESIPPDIDEAAAMLGLSYETTERIEAALNGECEDDYKEMLAALVWIHSNKRPV